MIEYSYLNCMPGTPAEPSTNLGIMADMIKKNGARHFVLSSDLGRCNAIHPVDGFKAFLEGLMRCGISREEIDMMVRINPTSLMHNG